MFLQQQQPSQPPVYSDLLRQSLSTLVQCKLPLLRALTEMLLGNKSPPCPEGELQAEPAPRELGDAVVAAGTALIEKYLPQVSTNHQSESNKQNSLSEDSAAAERSSMITAASNSDNRRRCALIFAAVIFDQCFEPDTKDFPRISTAVRGLVHLDKPVFRVLDTSGVFLDQLHAVLKKDEKQSPPSTPASTSSEGEDLELVVSFLINLPPPPTATLFIRNAGDAAAESSSPLSTSNQDRIHEIESDMDFDIDNIDEDGKGAPLGGLSMSETLGFVDYPKISYNKHDFTLGRILGKGESCRTYGCVAADYYTKIMHKIVRADDCTNAFVVKMYRSIEGAERERKIYNFLADKNVPGTTKILRGYELATTDFARERMLIVTPRAVHFKTASVGGRRTPLDTSTTEDGAPLDEDDDDDDEDTSDEENVFSVNNAQSDAKNDEACCASEGRNANDDAAVVVVARHERRSDMNAEPAAQAITTQHVEQLTRTLSSLHAVGMIHCDIQRQNLFYDSDQHDVALINDFGRARLVTGMRFCEFRYLMEVDWKKLELAVCESGKLINGRESWENFWKK